MCTNTTAVARSIIVIARSKFTFLISRNCEEDSDPKNIEKKIDKVFDNRMQMNFSKKIHFIVV